MSPVFHFRWNSAKILSCPTYVIFPSPNQPCANPSQFLNCISVLSYFHPRAHLPCASPSQFRCLLLNMRSADLKIQPSATTRQNTAETKSGKSWQKKVVTISGNFAENLKCSRFHSTNLPTRFCSWPRSLWSLKWKCGNRYHHRSLFRRVVCVLMSDVSVGDFCKQKKSLKFLNLLFSCRLPSSL